MIETATAQALPSKHRLQQKTDGLPERNSESTEVEAVEHLGVRLPCPSETEK